MEERFQSNFYIALSRKFSLKRSRKDLRDKKVNHGDLGEGMLLAEGTTSSRALRLNCVPLMFEE